jgi:hypothetical protein
MTPRHRAIEFRRWLLRHPRFHLHFTPTYSSWLNLVERWFAELTSKWLKRGTHRSVGELTTSIQSWIDTWNDAPRPFVWTKTADQIFENITRSLQRISNSVAGSQVTLGMRENRAGRPLTSGVLGAGEGRNSV